MVEDFERCYRAVESRDQRFDGWIYTAVTSTGIYCRPSCPAKTPHRRNVRFFADPAAAQAAGFRACKRCRPDASPGSPEWDARADLVGRAMRLIADGVIDREGVTGLARRLGYTERQVRRQLVAEVGASPLAIARAQRAQTARTLIESTDMPMTRIAFAAGFASIRQFNDVVRAVYALTPTELRARRNAAPTANGSFTIRLPYRGAYAGEQIMSFLGYRAIDGVERLTDGTYRRTLRLPRGHGIVDLTPAQGHFTCRLQLKDIRDLTTAVQRCRALLDLDADPDSIEGVLARTKHLRASVRRSPGRRVPGAVDGFEMAVRALLGQQVLVAGARTLLSRLVAAYGDSLPDGAALFPRPERLAQEELLDVRIPGTRRNAVRELSARVADGRVVLDRGADRTETRDALVAIPGIGPWTAEYVAMRALGDPDAFLGGDLGIRKGAAKLGLPAAPRELERFATTAWSPWRSYASLHLWSVA